VLEPTTGYATLGDQRIAYMTVGDGPIDFVVSPSWYGSFDVEWEEPNVRMFIRRLAAFARVIRFDRRGSGASDPLPADALPPWESFAEEMECVMDALGSESAAIWADGDAGPVGLLFAATRPERTRALVVFHSSARFLAADDYPFGIPDGDTGDIEKQVTEGWGSTFDAALFVPSKAGDRDFERWATRLQRATTTPTAAARYMAAALHADARSLLPAVQAPTLVMHPVDSRVLPPEHGRYIADHIPRATFLELAGGDVMPFFDIADDILIAVEEFLHGSASPGPVNRTLATVLFTDIVDSTRLAQRMGDHRWRQVIDEHDDTVRQCVAAHSGRLVKSTGDGALATFDGPGRAVYSATDLRGRLERIDLMIRAGIHTGEIEVRNGDVGGVAVHLAARILSEASPGAILVSRTVKDLMMGTTIPLVDRGLHSLKGIEGDWELYSVESR
jgi:class 3 adenylate cyclase